MENKIITKKITKINNYAFEEMLFYDISVIKHIQTGYYNANHICKLNKTKFRIVKRSQYWTNYCEVLQKELDENNEKIRGCNFAPTKLMYKLNVSNGFKGYYIHPLLLNYLCEFVDYKFAIKVSRLMLIQNEEINLKNITLDEKINEMKEIVEALKYEKGIQNNLIIKQNEMIKSYKQTIELNNETIKSYENIINSNNEIIKHYEETINSNNKMIEDHKDFINAQMTELDILNQSIGKLNEELFKKDDIIDDLKTKLNNK